MSPEELNHIEVVITCTESAFDFGKSMSTYFHSLLGLNRNCRLFELKNACYSGVAGLQTAASFVLSGISPGAKVLLITTDISRFMAEEVGADLTDDWSFFEPSSGAGAVAAIKRHPTRFSAGYWRKWILRLRSDGYLPAGSR